METREIFRATGLPAVQNRFYPDEATARACPAGDISLVQDPVTGLVYNRAFDPALAQYGADYSSAPELSGAFRAHLEEVKGIIQRRFSGRLFEIGCGQGYFLNLLREAGFEAAGADPAYKGDSPFVVKAPFGSGAGLPADGIVLRHVLEHIPDPAGFLAGAARANGGRGKIYIEAPCFDWICRNRAWFDVHYEHVNYFRLSDFRRLFDSVEECGHLFGGQFLYVVADLASLREPVLREPDPPPFPADFLASVGPACAPPAAESGAVWGAASRGVIFAVYRERAGRPAAFAVDIDPARRGKYLAGSGLRVSSPGEAMAQLRGGDDIFVMNSNYLAEIKALSGGRYNYIRADHYEL